MPNCWWQSYKKRKEGRKEGRKERRKKRRKKGNRIPIKSY